MSQPRVPSSIYTVGHSNRSAEVFFEILASWDVDLLVDVRRYPSSRRHPHFNRPALAAFLEERGIRYRHEERLGGHRQARPDSVHTALDDGFRGYADHMGTRPFEDAVEQVLAASHEQVTALMCAEADPGHCHRRFLSDALVVRGVRVVHVLGGEESRDHELHPAAREDGNKRLVYPDLSPRQLELFA